MPASSFEVGETPIVENLIFRNIEAVTVRRWGMQS
jgi:hypothetical protein